MRESARLGRNFAAVATAQFVAQLLTFILSATIAITLGPSTYGLFVFGFAFPSLLLLLLSAGLDEVIAIDVAAKPSRAGSYLTTVALLRLPLAAISAVALWISLSFLLDDPFARNVTFVLGVSALLQTYGGTFLSFFRAFERLEYTALTVLVERGFTIGVAILLLSRGYSVFEVALAFLAGAGISLAMSITLLRRKFARFSPHVDRGTARVILRKTVPFALSAVISTVIPSIGPVLLTISHGPLATGLFNAGLTLLMMVFSILTLCHVVLLPTLARIRASSPERLASILQHTQRFVFALGLPAALGAALYAETIVTRRYVVRIDLLNALGRPILAGSVMVLLLVLFRMPFWVGVPIGALIYFGSLLAIGGFHKDDWSMLRDAMKGALFRAV